MTTGTPSHFACPATSAGHWVQTWSLGVGVCTVLSSLAAVAPAAANQAGTVPATQASQDVGRKSAEPDAPERPLASPPPRLTLSADGKEVIDARAKLAWRRCVEGMIWFGSTCTGRPKTFTMAEAQALVASEGKATGQRWRLPHIPELKLLIDKSQAGRGAWVDATLFPATPSGWHWSASVSVGVGGSVNQYNYGNIMSGVTPGNANQLKALEGWGMNFATGEASGGISKRDALYVRLVRPHF